MAYEELARLEGTVPRLAGAYRFALPRLSSAYAHHCFAANPASDGSAIRTLGIVGEDLNNDWREGEIILQKMLTDTGTIDLAAATVARLEQLGL
jgi:hypothetical protein